MRACFEMKNGRMKNVPMPPPLLTLSHIGKAFGGTRALIDAHLELHAGEITALVGENGAGKSTLVKIIAGLHTPDSGEIRIDGRVVQISSPGNALELGISVVHQESVLFDNLSVAENILIDARPARRGLGRGLVDWRELRRRAIAILLELDSPLDADRLVGDLSVAEKHLVQIARGLSRDARVMILDEPTAALSHREAQDLLRTMQRLKTHGCALLLVSHRLEEIFSCADRYAVFRDGSSVAAGRLSEVTTGQLIQYMIGRPMEQIYPAPATPADELHNGPDDEVLRVEELSRDREFHDVSFSARRGEILGFYGLVGAGRSEVMQCVFGLTHADAGRVVMQGQVGMANSPAQAIAKGLAYVPEDRQHQGVILSFSIARNIALPNLQALSRLGMQRRSSVTDLAQHWIEALQIKAAGTNQAVENLSGGNQQKVVLAKWLATRPAVLIVDEPTKGIDVGAKAAVHEVLRKLADAGVAIVMVSSDLPEVLGMSDRMIVMRRGRVRARLDRADASAENLARAATAP